MSSEPSKSATAMRPLTIGRGGVRPGSDQQPPATTATAPRIAVTLVLPLVFMFRRVVCRRFFGYWRPRKDIDGRAAAADVFRQLGAGPGDVGGSVTVQVVPPVSDRPLYEDYVERDYGRDSRLSNCLSGPRRKFVSYHKR